MNTIEETILRIRDHLSQASYENESAVREAIVLPILNALGWDIWNPDIVKREYTLGSRRVDYALATGKRNLAVFIGAKPNFGW